MKKILISLLVILLIAGNGVMAEEAEAAPDEQESTSEVIDTNTEEGGEVATDNTSENSEGELPEEVATEESTETEVPAEEPQIPELASFSSSVTYNEDHTIATVTLTYEGECEELTIANQEGIQELVNIGVYQVDLERSDWVNTIVFNILLNGAFHFDINVWGAEDLIGTGTVVGYITGLNNDALVFEPGQTEQSTYTTVSSDVGISDSQSLEISYVTNVSYTWTIPTALELSDIRGSLPITINNSNLAPETALRVKINTANGFNLTNAEAADDLSYIVTDNNGDRVHDGDVILDHLFNQDSSSNTLNVDITRMPVYSGEYNDTWTFTASVERLLSDLYSGQVVTINQLGTTHNLIDMKIYGVGYQIQTEGKNIWNEQWETGGYANVDGVKTSDSSRIRPKDKIEVNLLVGREIYATHNLNIFAYNELEEYIGHKYIDKGKSYTVKDGTYYITFETMPTYGGVYKYDIALSLDENVKYEPYSNLKPSPSPQYPQEIKGVVNPKLKVCGKNLFSGVNYKGNAYIDKYGNIVSYSGYCVSDYIQINENTKYCFKAFDGNNIANGANINYYDENKKLLSTVEQPETDKFNEVTPSNAKYLKFSFIAERVNSIVVSVNDYTDTYEPYKEQTATLPYTLNAIPVSEGGNVTVNGQQYISDYIDIDNKELVRMVGDVDLGTLNWSNGTDGYGDIFFVAGPNNIREYDNTETLNGITTITNLFVNWNTINWTKSYNLYDKTIVASYERRLAIRDLNYTDATTFKQAMSGVKLLYELATPTTIDLTDDEVQAFKDLYTYTPTTTVITSSDQLTPSVEFGLS